MCERQESADLIGLAESYGAHNYAPLDVVIAHAEGAFVYDPEGRRYMDFLSCYSALNHGHRHPRIIEAMRRQLDEVTLTSRAFHNAQMGPFLKELCEYTGMEMALPMNTGAEAVETAIKAARKWAYRTKGVPKYEARIIACAGNFHGRTVSIVSMSTESLYMEDFGPFTPGFDIVPFDDPAAVESAITPNTAAVLVEPIQGEGGVVVPRDGYLKELREITRRHDVLLILDEIQTGFGRTGARFACDHEGVRPDLMCLGKALGGGVYPVSAVVGTREVLGLFRPGEHGSTFGGNPLACAVAREALRVLEDEGLVERARELGAHLMGRLREIDSPLIEEIRGKGLLVGVELSREAGSARKYCELLMERGVLCKETHEKVIRLAPPLVITKEQIDFAVRQLAGVLTGTVC